MTYIVYIYTLYIYVCMDVYMPWLRLFELLIALAKLLVNLPVKHILPTSQRHARHSLLPQVVQLPPSPSTQALHPATHLPPLQSSKASQKHLKSISKGAEKDLKRSFESSPRTLLPHRNRAPPSPLPAPPTQAPGMPALAAAASAVTENLFARFQWL